MRSRRGSTPALLLLAVLGASCGDEVPATVLLSVKNGAGGTRPDVVGVRVFDARAVAHEQVLLPVPDGQGAELGTLVIYPKDDLKLRIVVTGGRDNMAISQATLAVVLSEGKQVQREVELRSGPSPDRDWDSVPDAIDNCPITANAQQEDRDGDGLGDVCDAGAGDAGPAQDAAGQ